MASFFNLILDTLAPSGLTLKLNGGATYATSNTVTATITLTDETKTGYLMKLWGIKAAATETDASWETFAASKSIVLTDGDGLKTVHIKVRDDVGNETAAVTASITVNTAVPVVTITGPDKTRISKVSGFDTCAFSFVSDVDFEEYTVRVVPAPAASTTPVRRSRPLAVPATLAARLAATRRPRRSMSPSRAPTLRRHPPATARRSSRPL